MLLKLYLYGCLNRIRSNRRLAQETRRNLEMIWLVGHQHPSHTVIARFRADNALPLRETCRAFLEICRELDLLGEDTIGIDGTFIHSDASKASILTQSRLEKQPAQLEQSIETYLSTFDQADQEASELPTSDPALPEKLEQLIACPSGYLHSPPGNTG